nr:type II toxin-antitoxin system YoeB family toxin [Janibacter sp. YB324]
MLERELVRAQVGAVGVGAVEGVDPRRQLRPVEGDLGDQERRLLARPAVVALGEHRVGVVDLRVVDDGVARRDFAEYWYRRITDEHRLVYKVIGDEVRIAACRYHCG